MTNLRPMLAVSAPTLPTGADWTYDLKWDRYRALAVKDGGRVRLLSPNQKDLTRDYPAVAMAIGQLAPSRVVLDGELVAIDSEGRPSASVVAGSRVLLSEPLPGTVREIERTVREHGLEGVVAKRRGSVYRPGQRSGDWVKVKLSPRQEFVIGGYKPASGALDSVLVGYYDVASCTFSRPA
jgi:bifunctional non-homologous end joining protein LigD